jgi:hypothetical protein
MRAENIGELQIWIDGKFNLLSQAQNAAADEIRGLRSRLHDLSGEVMKLNSFDIEGKFKLLEIADAKHENAIQQFSTQAAERRGALGILKIIYTTGGAAMGAGLTLLLQLTRGVH